MSHIRTGRKAKGTHVFRASATIEPLDELGPTETPWASTPEWDYSQLDHAMEKPQVQSLLPSASQLISFKESPSQADGIDTILGQTDVEDLEESIPCTPRPAPSHKCVAATRDTTPTTVKKPRLSSGAVALGKQWNASMILLQ